MREASPNCSPQSHPFSFPFPFPCATPHQHSVLRTGGLARPLLPPSACHTSCSLHASRGAQEGQSLSLVSYVYRLRATFLASTLSAFTQHSMYL